jgi:hypothetical protein
VTRFELALRLFDWERIQTAGNSKDMLKVGSWDSLISEESCY